MMHRDVRLRKLIDGLRRQIVEGFSPGAQLPSKRRFAALHGVGPTTVHRALLALHAEGVVRVEPRHGFFRSESGARPKRSGLTIAILTRRTRSEWERLEIYGEILAEAQRRGIKVVEVPHRHIQRPTPGRTRIDLERVPWNTFDVGLLVEAEDTITLDDPFLREHRVLAVDQDATAYGIESVVFNDRAAGALALRHLHELGHTRFAVSEELSDPGMCWDPNWTWRRLGFEEALGSVGGVLLPEWRLIVPRRSMTRVAHDYVAEAVKRWAAAPVRQRPTGLFTFAPDTVPRLITELARYGLRVPRDLSIVSLTWNQVFCGGAPPVCGELPITCVDLNLSALVQRALDVAAVLGRRRVSSTLAPQLHYAPVAILPGQSTAPPLNPHFSPR